MYMANNGAADILHASGQVTLETISLTIMQATVTHDAEAAVGGDAEMPAALVPAGQDDSRSRVYIMISKKGNKTTYDRDSIVSTIELELEAAGWEPSPGLPALRQCPGDGPFPMVTDKGGADNLRNNNRVYVRAQHAHEHEPTDNYSPAR